MTHAFAPGVPAMSRFAKRRFVPAFAACMIFCASLSSAFAPHAFAQSDRGFGDPNRAVSGTGGGGDLVAQSPTVDGGTITTGSTAQVVVLFRNDHFATVLKHKGQLYLLLTDQGFRDVGAVYVRRRRPLSLPPIATGRLTAGLVGVVSIWLVRGCAFPPV